MDFTFRLFRFFLFFSPFILFYEELLLKMGTISILFSLLSIDVLLYIITANYELYSIAFDHGDSPNASVQFVSLNIRCFSGISFFFRQSDRREKKTLSLRKHLVFTIKIWNLSTDVTLKWWRKWFFFLLFILNRSILSQCIHNAQSKRLYKYLGFFFPDNKN